MIGSLPRVFDMIAYVAQEEGVFEKHGINVEIVSFRSTVEMNVALLSGDLDGIIQDVFGAVNLNKEEKTSKIVGWAAMPRMFEVVASQQSGVGSVLELRGKEVAVANSTIMEYALDRLLLEHGLESDDIIKVNIPALPLRLEALNQGKVPLAILTPPLSDMAVLQGGKVIVSDEDKPFAGPGLLFSLEALDNKSDAIGSCVQAWQETVEVINRNPGKYQQILNEVAFVPETVNLPVPHFPQLGLSMETSVESVIDWMLSRGLLSQRLTYEQVVETKYLR